MDASVLTTLLERKKLQISLLRCGELLKSFSEKDSIGCETSRFPKENKKIKGLI